MKYFAAIMILFVSKAALGDPITTAAVQKKLQSDFSTADRIEVMELKENFWGLYRNYKVSFKARFPEGTYQVSCDLVAPRRTDMALRDCAAVDRQGETVDIAKFYGKEQRLPAAKR